MKNKNKSLDFLSRVENRYGIRFTFKNDDRISVIVCEDRRKNDYNLPDCIVFKWGVIPPDDCIDRQVEILDLKLKDVNSLNDIYTLTKSGFNSRLHKVNNGVRKSFEYLSNEYDGIHNIPSDIKDELFEKEKLLIPVILIRPMKGRDYTLSFRVDNPIIREMFYDTESEIDGYKEHSKSSLKEYKKEVDRRKEEHDEYIDYFFKKKRGGDWIETYFKKCKEGKKDLLHREYLMLSEDGNQNVPVV